MTDTPIARWKRQPIEPILGVGDDRPHAVYFAYDPDQTLIYVGISCEPRTRLRAHARSAWGHEIAFWSADWYPNRTVAERAETDTIAEARPRHNVYGTPRFSQRCIETHPRHRHRRELPWQEEW